MDGLENRSKEELLKELEEMEEKYVRNLTSKFDRNELSRIWDRIKELKDELSRRDNRDKENL